MRRKAFETIMKQEMGWFDEKANNTGALCARLSGDAAKIHGATGSRVGMILQGVFGLIIAIIVALYYSWRLGLVTSILFPLLIGVVIVQQRIIIGNDTVEKNAFEASAKVVDNDLLS